MDFTDLDPTLAAETGLQQALGGGGEGVGLGGGGIGARQTHHPITHDGWCSTLPDAQLRRSHMDTPVHSENVKRWW